VEFLTWLNREVKKQNPDAYLVGECWTGQETYAKYYDSGVDSFFDFAFADQDGIIANVVRGTKPVSYYAKSLEKEEALYKEHNPSYINAPFYTNHDMGRSTGYYAYDDGTRTKFAGALNLLMPGNAFLYYGEELGMKGSGKDENKRAPMQWGENDPMLCAGPPGMDSFEMKFDSLDRQKEDPGSIFHYYKNVLRIRNRFPVIRNGSTHVQDALTTETVCGFTREAEGEGRVLLVINGGEEMEAISLSGTHFTKLSDSLSVSEQEVAMQGDTVILPPFGIAVFEEENND
jgi:glycosidase